MTVPLLREELVEASVLRCVVAGLPSYGFTLQAEGFAGPAPNLVVRETFPTPEERNGELEVCTLAFGFAVDDGGEPAEMGSTLTTYVHTLTCWVFGIEPRFARKVADSIKHIARVANDTIPLLDFDQDGDPQIDTMNVLKVQTQHQGNNSPRPWDLYVWTSAINVRDVAYP